VAGERNGRGGNERGWKRRFTPHVRNPETLALPLRVAREGGEVISMRTTADSEMVLRVETESI